MKHPSRRGFTLIELMIVIGIILVLVAIVVLGLRHVNYVAARHETIAEMKILSDMLTEYKNVHGSLGETTTQLSGGTTVTVPSGIEMPQLPAGSQMGSATIPPPSAGTPSWAFTINLPVYVDSTAVPPVPISGGSIQPASELLTDDFAGRPNSAGNGSLSSSSRDMGDKLDGASARYYSHAVGWTQAVNLLLLREPRNRSALGNVPTKRLLEAPQDSSGGAPAGGSAGPVLDCPVVLDGWGNPIVFVPRGGMHVMLKQGNATLSEYVLRTSGTYLYNASASAGGPSLVPPVGPNDHPFFASAGQDGVFTDSSNNATNGADYAIDNVYSFQE